MENGNPLTLNIDTDRFGPFTFQVGVDMASLQTLLLRVEDAHQRLYLPR